jgi:hypothetical protein
MLTTGALDDEMASTVAFLGPARAGRRCPPENRLLPGSLMARRAGTLVLLPRSALRVWVWPLEPSHCPRICGQSWSRRSAGSYWPPSAGQRRLLVPLDDLPIFRFSGGADAQLRPDVLGVRGCLRLRQGADGCRRCRHGCRRRYRRTFRSRGGESAFRDRDGRAPLQRPELEPRAPSPAPGTTAL